MAYEQSIPISVKYTLIIIDTTPPVNHQQKKPIIGLFWKSGYLSFCGAKVREIQFPNHVVSMYRELDFPVRFPQTKQFVKDPEKRFLKQDRSQFTPVGLRQRIIVAQQFKNG
jgi:hypothetical protein